MMLKNVALNVHQMNRVHRVDFGLFPLLRRLKPVKVIKSKLARFVWLLLRAEATSVMWVNGTERITNRNE